MRIVLFTLLLQLWANLNVASKVNTNTSDISELSSKSIDLFFNKYSKSDSLNASDFKTFLSKVSGTLEESCHGTHDHDHDHTHDHSHTHDHDHSHEHHEVELDHHHEDHNKFDYKCFESKVNLLKSIPRDSISQKDFAELSSIFLVDLDSCIVKPQIEIPDNSTFIEKIQTKRESK